MPTNLDSIMATVSVGNCNDPCPPLSSASSTLGLVLLPDPFNPATSLPSRVVKKVLNLEFVEMSVLASGADASQQPGQTLAPAGVQ